MPWVLVKKRLKFPSDPGLNSDFAALRGFPGGCFWNTFESSERNKETTNLL